MVVHRLTGYTVIIVRKVRLIGNTNCIHAIRMPHTPTMVSMAVAATGSANRGILSHIVPCSMSSCCFSLIVPRFFLLSDLLPPAGQSTPVCR